MKKTIFFIGLFIIFKAHAQFRIATGKSKVPLSCVKINEGKYINQTEVSVGDWLVYCLWTLDHAGYDEAYKLLPDSNCMRREVWDHLTLKLKRFRETTHYRSSEVFFHSRDYDDIVTFRMALSKNKVISTGSYNKEVDTDKEELAYISDLPVNCISYEQANEYCEWRSLLNPFFKFGLPAIHEWQEVALSKLNEKEKSLRQKDSVYYDTKLKKKLPAFNYKEPFGTVNLTTQLDLYPVALIYTGKPRIYDIFGNVSEMMLEEGIARGGNFILSWAAAHLDSVQHYSKPEIWLGFRFIMLEKDNIKKEKVSEKLPANRMLDSRDGKIYRTVTIGDRLWMAENLAYKPDSGAFTSFAKDERYVPHYGYLYAWETACKVCPQGWSLPSASEFDSLLHFAGSDSLQAFTSLFLNGNTGFSAYASPIKTVGSVSLPPTYGCYLWSSSISKNRPAYLNVWLYGRSATLERRGHAKSDKLPVRCIKNREQ